MQKRIPLIKMKLIKASFLALLAPLLLATQASGAVITWAASAVNVDTSDASQISTAGTLFAAVDMYSNFSGVSYNVNGVTFTASNPNVTIGRSGALNFGTAPGTTNYSFILDQGAYIAPDSASPSNPIQISGLLSGHTYQLQLWTPYWNGNFPTRFSDVAPTGPTYLHALNESPTVNAGFTGLGPTHDGATISQYILGTFTADGSGLQSLYYYGDGDAALFGAMQIREVPEPTTVTLLALGGLALVLRRRIRQRGKLIA